jgi:hypothetical protein
MLERVARLQRGDEVPTVPAEDVTALIARRLCRWLYRVEQDPAVLEQLAALPLEALKVLRRVVELPLRPHQRLTRGRPAHLVAAAFAPAGRDDVDGLSEVVAAMPLVR